MNEEMRTHFGFDGSWISYMHRTGVLAQIRGMD
jgi:hypothetical protein